MRERKRREQLTRAICHPFSPDRTFTKVIERLLCNVRDIGTHTTQCTRHGEVAGVHKRVSASESEKHGACLISSKARVRNIRMALSKSTDKRSPVSKLDDRLDSALGLRFLDDRPEVIQCSPLYEKGEADVGENHKLPRWLRELQCQFVDNSRRRCGGGRQRRAQHAGHCPSSSRNCQQSGILCEWWALVPTGRIRGRHIRGWLGGWDVLLSGCSNLTKGAYAG